MKSTSTLKHRNDIHLFQDISAYLDSLQILLFHTGVEDNEIDWRMACSSLHSKKCFILLVSNRDKKIKKLKKGERNSQFSITMLICPKSQQMSVHGNNHVYHGPNSSMKQHLMIFFYGNN